MKTRTRLAVLVLLALAGAAGAWWWQRAGADQAAVAAALPPPPDLTGANPALRDRLAAAEARARSRLSARRGLVELSRLYHANGYLAEAMESYTGLETLAPGEPRWPHLHATILAGYGQVDEAAALWQRVLTLDPGYLPARLRLGDVQLKSNQRAAAAATYNQVLQRSPDQPYALLGLARLDLEAGRWEPARQRLETVVVKTNYQLGYDLIVSLYEKLGQTDRATAIRASAKASGAYRDPDDPWLDELIADCYDPYRLSLAAGTLARNGRQDEAVRLLERAIAIAPEDVSSRFQLGTLLAERNELAAAREQLERCTLLSPDFSDGWVQLSALQARQGESAAAERTLAAGLKNCPQSPGLHLMSAQNLRKAGRLGEAIAAYRTSIRLRPNEPDAYLELGNLLIGQGREAEALEQFRGALEAEPGNPAALGILTFHAITTGNEADAHRWLTRVRQQPRVPREQVEHLLAAFREQFGRAFR